MPGPGNPNQTMQQDYVLGPDGKTLGFYDQFGNFIPSNASTANANPYVGGMNTPILQSTFSPNQTTNNMAGVMLGMGQKGAPTPLPDDQANSIVSGIQKNFMGAEQTGTEGLTDVVDTVGETGKQLNPQLVKGGIGMAANAIGALGSTMGKGYDARIGMERPSLLKSMTDLQFTQMGSNLGPVGAAVGLGVDVVKNLLAFQKHKSQFNKAETKANFYDERGQMLNEMQPDFTGLAKYGLATKAKFGMNKNPYRTGSMTPVELEKKEAVYVQNEDGSYAKYMETGDNAPTHEQGGVKTALPDGAVVFPDEFRKEAEDAFMYGGKTGDWSRFGMIKDKMLKRANQAYKQGKPFSSGGAMGYGGKYRDGGNVGPYVPKMPTPETDFYGRLQSMTALKDKQQVKNIGYDGTTSVGINYRYDDEGFPVIELSDEELDMDVDETAKSRGKKPTTTPVGNLGGSEKLPIGSVKHTGNRGIVSGQQEILNQMIKDARLSGATDVPEYLVVDDVMGARTRAAMDYFEQRGDYKTPTLLSAANVAKYQENWKRMSNQQKIGAILSGARAIGLTADELRNGQFTTKGGNRPKESKADQMKVSNQHISNGVTPLVKAPGLPSFMDAVIGGKETTEGGTQANPKKPMAYMPVLGLIGYEPKKYSNDNITDDEGTLPVPGLFLKPPKEYKSRYMAETIKMLGNLGIGKGATKEELAKAKVTENPSKTQNLSAIMKNTYGFGMNNSLEDVLNATERDLLRALMQKKAQGMKLSNAEQRELNRLNDIITTR